MQILRVPFHYEDMTAQATLTGITLLKTSKFKSRHGGPKELVQQPREGLIKRKDGYDRQKEILNLKQVKKRRKTTHVPKQPKSHTTKNYSINKKEVSHRIRNFVNQMPGVKQLYFWTVTFPLNTTDDTAFILMNKWLTRLKRDLNLRSYIWITERQQNGTIHFHIALHQRLCVKKANRFMRAAIFTSIDNKEIIFTREQAKNYNGVDIAKNRKTRKVTNFAIKKNEKNLINYLLKYVTKNDATFSHLAWHSSRDYSNLIIAVRLTEKEFNESGIKQFIGSDCTFESEWFMFFKWTTAPPKDLLKYLAFINQVAIKLVTKN